MKTPRPITEAQLRWLKPFIKFFTKLHITLYKLSGGKLFNRLGGGEICVVKMKGARSGKVMEIPLMHVPYENGIVLVASLAGAPRHPVWYHNLVANPEIEVTARGRVQRFTARFATAEEKTRIWPVCDEIYPDFELYRRRTNRDIPIFICEPVQH